MSNENIEKTKVLLGATGSVASIKIPDIISGMNIKFNGNVEIRFVPTQNALHFLPQVDEIEDKLGAKIYRDEDEWSSWSKRGDPVLHIELRKWADVLILGNIFILTTDFGIFSAQIIFIFEIYSLLLYFLISSIGCKHIG